jgi:hypothetical protein
MVSPRAQFVEILKSTGVQPDASFQVVFRSLAYGHQDIMASKSEKAPCGRPSM